MAHNVPHRNPSPATGPNIEIPETISSAHPPQLDLVKTRSRSGCACATSRADRGIAINYASQEEQEDDRIVLDDESVMSVPDSDSEQDRSSIKGDQGVERHQVGDLGSITNQHLLDLVLKHQRCILCRCCVMENASEEPRYAFRAPVPLAAFGILQSSIPASSSSAIVEPGSGEHSMAQSTIMSLHSDGSAEEHLRFAGSVFDAKEAGGVLGVGYQQAETATGVGSGRHRYPWTLSLDEDGKFATFDMW